MTVDSDCVAAVAKDVLVRSHYIHSQMHSMSLANKIYKLLFPRHCTLRGLHHWDRTTSLIPAGCHMVGVSTTLTVPCKHTPQTQSPLVVYVARPDIIHCLYSALLSHISPAAPSCRVSGSPTGWLRVCSVDCHCSALQTHDRLLLHYTIIHDKIVITLYNHT